VAARLASLDHVTNGVCHLVAIRSEQRGQAETFFCGDRKRIGNSALSPLTFGVHAT